MRKFTSYLLIFAMLIGIVPNFHAFAFFGDVADYGNIDVKPFFIENQGQGDEAYKYYFQGAPHSFYFSNNSISMRSLYSEEVGQDIGIVQSFPGSNANVKILPLEIAETRVNYFIGEKSNTNIPTFNRLKYQSLYDGIDAEYYFEKDSKKLKYDVVVKAGADPSLFKFKFEGIKDVYIAENGNLIIDNGYEKFIQNAPFTYQIIDGEQVEVESSFSLDNGVINFELGEYDKTRTLVIDPLLDSYYASTYVGTSGTDKIFAVDRDSNGNVYVAGTTTSSSFSNPVSAYVGGTDVFIAKYSANLTSLSAITYIGSTATDSVKGMIVDGSNNVYIVGKGGTNFPSTTGTVAANTTGYVAYLNSSLVLQASRHLDSSSTTDEMRDIDVDGGYVWVIGIAGGANFPQSGVSPTYSYMNGTDVVVAKLSTSLVTLSNATYFGTHSGDQGYSIKHSGSYVYIAGTVESSISTGSVAGYDTSFSGQTDIFISKLSDTTLGVSKTTYDGGSGFDYVYDMDIEGSYIYIGGSTDGDQYNFFANGYDTTNSTSDTTGILVRTDTDLSGRQATFIGGSWTDRVYAVDATDSYVYFAGETASSDFPDPSAVDGTINGTDGFVGVMNTTLTSLSEGTFLGGSGTDLVYDIEYISSDSLLAVGETASSPDVGSTSTSNFYIYTDTPMITNQGGIDGLLVNFGAARAISTLPSNWAAATESDVAAISVSEVASITCANIDAMPAAAAAGFTEAQIPNLTYTAGQSTYTQGYGYTTAIECFDSSQLGYIVASRTSAFTTAQLQRFYWEAFSGLTAAHITDIPDANFSVFTSPQMANLTNAAIGALTATKIDYIPASSIGGTNGMHAGQIPYLTTSAIASFASTQISALSDAAAAALTSTQIDAVADSAMAGFSAVDIDSFSVAKIEVLTSGQISNLTTSAVASLNSTQIAAIPNAATAGFTNTQIDYISNTDIAGFTSTQVPYFTTSAVNSFTAAQLNAFTVAELDAFSQVQVDAMDSSAIAGVQALDAAKYAALGGGMATPGGVSGNMFQWFKADGDVTAASGSVSEWKDQTLNDWDLKPNDVGITAGTNPTLTSNAINGNPSISFPNATDRLGKSGITNFPDTTLTQFIVLKRAGTSMIEHPYSFASSSASNEYLFVMNGGAHDSYFYMNNTGYNPTGTHEFDTGYPMLFGMDWRSSDGAAHIYSNGTGTSFTGRAASLSSTGTLVLAEDQDSLGGGFDVNQAFRGEIAEIITYDAVLSDSDRQKVESYLAAKYGITIDDGANDYVASDGSTLIWDASDNTSYSNDIAIIGRDNNSNLLQLSSKSENSDSLVTITALSGNVSNLEFLSWSNNNGDYSSWTASNAPSGYQRIARTWRANEENGDTGTLTVSVADSSLPASTENIVLLVDGDTDFSNATIVSMTESGGVWSGSVNLSNGQLFSFAEVIPSTLPSNWAVATESDVAAISVGEVGSITCANIQALPAASSSGFTPSQIPSLTTSAINCFTVNHIADLDASDIGAMSSTQLGSINYLIPAGGDTYTRPVRGLTQAQIEAISSSNFAGFTLDQIMRFNTVAIQGMSAGHIDNISTAQAFRDWQMPYLSTSAVASLNVSQITAIEDVAIAAMLSTQIDAVADSAMAGFSAIDIDSFTAAKMGVLTSGQISYLTTSAVASFDATQIGNIVSAEFSGFTANQISEFSTAAVAAISASQFNDMDDTVENNDIAGFTSTQISFLIDAVLNAFELSDMQRFSVSAVAGFNGVQVDTLGTKVGSFSQEQILNLSTGALGSLNTVQLNSIALATLQAFNDTQKSYLNISAVNGLLSLDADKYNALVIDSSNLTSTQIAGADCSYFSDKSDTFFDNLTTTAVAGFTSTHMPCIDGTKLKRFSKGHFENMPGDAIEAINSTQYNELSTEQISGHLIENLDAAVYQNVTREEFSTALADGFNPGNISAGERSKLQNLPPEAITAISADFVTTYWNTWGPKHMTAKQITGLSNGTRVRANLEDTEYGGSSYFPSVGNGLSAYNFSGQLIEVGGTVVGDRYTDVLFKDEDGDCVGVVSVDMMNPITDDLDFHGVAAGVGGASGSIFYAYEKGTETEDSEAIKGLCTKIDSSDVYTYIWEGVKSIPEMIEGTHTYADDIDTQLTGGITRYGRTYYALDSDFNTTISRASVAYTISFVTGSGGQGGGEEDPESVPEFGNHVYLFTMMVTLLLFARIVPKFGFDKRAS